MKERILNIETVHQCNCCLGCKTLHPLVSVIDLSKSNLEQQIIKFDFYTILMMEGEIDDVLYGRKYYHLTEKGRKQLAVETQQWRSYEQVINAVLSMG